MIHTERLLVKKFGTLPRCSEEAGREGGSEYFIYPRIDSNIYWEGLLNTSAEGASF